MKKWFLHLIGKCTPDACSHCTDELVKKYMQDLSVKYKSGYFDTKR